MSIQNIYYPDPVSFFTFKKKCYFSFIYFYIALLIVTVLKHGNTTNYVACKMLRQRK